MVEWGRKDGQCWRALAGKRLGIEKRMPIRTIAQIEMTFQRGKSSIVTLVSVVRRVGVRLQHGRQSRLHRPNSNALSDLDLHFCVRHLGHAATKPSASDHLIALLDRGQLRLMLLRASLLRSDQKHIEDD